MGVYYSYYLIPELSSMRFLPSPQQVSEIAALLRDSEWVDKEVAEFRVSYADEIGNRHREQLSVANISEDVNRLMTQQKAILIEMPGVPAEVIWPDGHLRSDGSNRKYDFEDCDPAVFKPEYVDEIFCVLTEHLCTVPEDANESPVPCPSCQEDINVPIAGKAPQSLSCLQEIGIDSMPSRRCPSCGQELELQALVCQSRDGTTGELRLEPAPFFCFALMLCPVPKATPSVEPVEVDQGLLTRLEKVSGVKFRGVGRYS